MTSSPGFNNVFKITFRPPAAPTVIIIFFAENAVSNFLLMDSATA